MTVIVAKLYAHYVNSRMFSYRRRNTRKTIPARGAVPREGARRPLPPKERPPTGLRPPGSCATSERHWTAGKKKKKKHGLTSKTRTVAIRRSGRRKRFSNAIEPRNWTPTPLVRYAYRCAEPGPRDSFQSDNYRFSPEHSTDWRKEDNAFERTATAFETRRTPPTRVPTEIHSTSSPEIDRLVLFGIRNGDRLNNRLCSKHPSYPKTNFHVLVEPFPSARSIRWFQQPAPSRRRRTPPERSNQTTLTSSGCTRLSHVSRTKANGRTSFAWAALTQHCT